MNNKENKSILFCGYDFTEKYQRGVGFYTKSLMKAINQLGYNSYILTNTKVTKTQDGLKQVPLPLENNKKKHIQRLLLFLKDFILSKDEYIELPVNTLHSENTFDYIKHIKGFVNKENIYDLIYLNSLFFSKPYKIPFPKPSAIFTTNPLSIKPAYNTKLFQTLHDIIPISTGNHSSYNSKVFYSEIKSMLIHSDRIISVSEFSKNEVLKVFPGYEDKISVIYQPVPIFEEEEKYIFNNPEFESMVLRSNNLEAGEYFLFTGFIEKRKNIQRLIKAYQIIENKIKIPLVLTGNLDNDRDLKSFLKNNLSKSILHLGYISTLEKLALLRNAKAFIFPSLLEGFGLPPIEAMRMNTPVITSNTSSLPEVCQDAAILINPLKTEEIAGAMYEVAENPQLRQELIIKGYQRSSFFSFQNYQNRLKDLFFEAGL